VSTARLGAQQATGAFRHEAFLYNGLDEFTPIALSFIMGGLADDVPVLVVLGAEKIELLRAQLPEDPRLYFADMGVVGRNPARIIPLWYDFVAAFSGGDRPLRGLGEAFGQPRGAPEHEECELHESLLNLAFAAFPAFWLMCPYDMTQLRSRVIDQARCNHPFILEGGVHRSSSQYRDIASSPNPFGAPLADPPNDAFRMEFGLGQLRVLRTLAAHYLGLTGLDRERMDDLVLAINEVATNSVQHAGGHGTLRIWQEGKTVLCEVRDDGYITDPLVGRRTPGFGDEASRGFWVVNQLCDLVQVRSSPAGTVVRMHMDVPGRW
jgi:anti-sigma regulatory factor (Ser/Thr protein kinase)